MVFYFVQRGETLYAIAKRYRITVHALVAANRLEDPNAIYPGQALIIPRPGEVPSPPPGGIVHLVRRGETVFELARRFRTSAQEILQANQIVHPEFVLPGQQLVIPEPSEPEEEWPMLGRTPARSGASPVVLLGEPRPDWSYRPLRQRGMAPSPPVIRYGRVYAGLGDGGYYSLDLKTGLVKWRFSFGPQSEPVGHALPAPVLYDGLAYLCGPLGSLAGIDAYTGKMIWRYETQAPIISSPLAQEGALHVAAGTEVCALEVKTGTVIWKSQVGSAISRPVAAGDGKLFVVTGECRLVALDAETGQICWQTDGVTPGDPVFATIAVVVGNRAYDPSDGALRWQAPTEGEPLAALMDRVYYRQGMVDLFTGQMTATYPLAGQEPNPEPAEGRQQAGVWVLAGALLLGMANNHLCARHVHDGSPVWTIVLPGSGAQPPAVTTGRLALTLTDGSVHTYQFSTEEKTD